MQADPTRTGDAKAWPQKAAQDIRRVEILLAAIPADVEGALFHCQQAAEKALKGFLTWRDVEFRRVHDLDEIGKQCVEVDSSLTGLLERAESLTAYASRFRYPGAPYQPEIEEAATALGLAREVVDSIISRLPLDAHP